MEDLLKDQVYRDVKRRILQHQYAGGDRLSANQLADEYNTSATPVRQALSALEEDGLVSVIPRVGCFVAPITVADVREMFQLRMILEAASAEIAAQRISDDELRRLEEIQYGYERGSSGSRQQYIRMNRDFHGLIASATGNARLARLIADLLDEMERLIYGGLLVKEYAEHFEEHHPRLIEALKDRDAARARAVMLEGLRRTRDAAMEAIVGETGFPIS